jgi:hypothetical protein
MVDSYKEPRLFEHSPNLVCICIDKIDLNITTGRIFTYYNSEPVIFNSVDQIFLILENFFDDIDFPQASTQTRGFAERKTANLPLISTKSGKIMSWEELTGHQGTLATFLLHVKYRQNSTWQGNLKWVEKNKTRSFQSDLEFMELVNTAIAEK